MKKLIVNKSFEITRATTMVLSDFPLQSVDVVLLFSKSLEDSPALMQLASDLILKKIASSIFLVDQEGERWNGRTKHEANPGKDYYVDELLKRGVDVDKIIMCPHPIRGQVGFNTREESDAFLIKSAEKGYKTAVLITQPHQILRAALGTLRTINNKKYDVDFWCAVPQSTNWFENAGGSQGMEVKPRIDCITDEVERIINYQEKGDLASFEEFYEYLHKRDKKSNLIGQFEKVKI